MRMPLMVKQLLTPDTALADLRQVTTFLMLALQQLQH